MGKIVAGIMVLVLVGVGPPAVCQDLTIVTEDFPPLNYTQEGELTGSSTAVVREILRRHGQKYPIQVLPWARAYRLLMTEPNVMLYSIVRTEQRESLFHWVGPLNEFRLGFYARKGARIRIESIEDAKKVGAIATYKDDFREQMLKSMGFENLDSANTPESGLQKLMAGRVDLWFSGNLGAPKMAAELCIDTGEIEEVFPVKRQFTYLAFSKSTPAAVVQQWQTTLDKMKADGTFWWLCSKWLPPDSITVHRGNAGDISPVRIAIYTENNPPSSYLKNGEPAGFSVDMVREILRRVGQTQTIEMVPWARGYRLAMTEPNVVLFSTTRLKQREHLFYWVGPLYTQTWGFYALRGAGPQVSSLPAAKQVERIGTYRQDAKMQYLEKLGFTNLAPANRNISNIRHLVRKEIDLWVSSDFNMPYLVKQVGVDPDELRLALAFREVENYFAFSRQTSPHIAYLWQRVLEELRKDGTYRSVARKHGVSDNG